MPGVRRWIVAVVGVSCLTSCVPMGASWPGGNRAEVSSVRIEVWHNAPVANALTVYLIGSDGVAHRLGRVSPSATMEFQVPRADLGSDYRLVAETAMGGRVRSPFFSLTVSYGVTWDVDRNRIGPLWEPGADDPGDDDPEPPPPSP
jgi:hypothetical protein